MLYLFVLILNGLHGFFLQRYPIYGLIACIFLSTYLCTRLVLAVNICIHKFLYSLFLSLSLCLSPSLCLAISFILSLCRSFYRYDLCIILYIDVLYISLFLSVSL